MESIKLGGFVIQNIEAINNNFSELDTGKANTSDIPVNVSDLTNDSEYQTKTQLASVIKGFVIDDKTGIITLTKYDGSTSEVDTLLEKIAVNFYLDEETEEIVLVNEDGTEQRVSLSAFIDVYTGETTTSGTITVTSNNKISFNLADKAVTLAKLGDDVTTKFTSVENELNNKVDKVEGKQLSTEDYTTSEKQKLAGLQNYSLPIAGDTLGGVKNGGNVVIGNDGSMNVNLPGSFTKLNFTASDDWVDDATLGTQTYKKLSLEAGGKSPLAVFRKNGTVYEQVVAYLAVNGTNVDIANLEAFEGYVICV